MFRRLLVLSALAVLLPFGSGCRSSCNSPCGGQPQGNCCNAPPPGAAISAVPPPVSAPVGY